jgi:hypothetical protein
MALHRAQILLDKDQHAQLERLARESGRSISDLTREIVAAFLAQASEEEAARRSLAALEGLATIRTRIETQHGLVPAGLLEDERGGRGPEVKLEW